MENHNGSDDINEGTMHIKLYWSKEPKYNFDAEIIEIDGNWVRLSDNHFYPESGGQLSDTGILLIGDDRINVVDVQKRDNTDWIKLDDIENLKIGLKIHARIDRVRRINLTRNHSTQHLISAVFWKLYENETIRAEIGVKETQIGLRNIPTVDEINSALLEAERIIMEQVSITSDFVDDVNRLSDTIRGGIKKDMPLYRLVNIGNYDTNLCGGTHLSNTSQIGGIYMHKVEGRKLRFYSGMFAKEEYIRVNADMHIMAKTLGTKLSDLSNSLNELKRNFELYRKENHTLKVENNSMNYNLLDWNRSGEYNYKVFETLDIEKGAILGSIGELEDNQLVFAVKPDNLLIVVSSSDSITADLMDFLRENGIKGGGRGRIQLGKLSQPIHEFKSLLKNIIAKL